MLFLPCAQCILPADPIYVNLAAVGRFDGNHPSLAYATTGGKVCIHSPHASGDQAQIQYLNINKEITALTAGKLEADSQRDILLVGTTTSLQAYDVHTNQDLFFKDIQDGACALAVVQLGWTGTPLVMVGGMCCILGIDSQGTERFWTVTGDRVTALAVSNVTDKGRSELLAGSDDFSIQALHHDSVAAVTAEAEKVIGLASLDGTKFGYALANGTVGAYDKGTRAWRVKSKHTLTALCSHDLDGDGEMELISGWSNGRVGPCKRQCIFSHPNHVCCLNVPETYLAARLFERAVTLDASASCPVKCHRTSVWADQQKPQPYMSGSCWHSRVLCRLNPCIGIVQRQGLSLAMFKRLVHLNVNKVAICETKQHL